MRGIQIEIKDLKKAYNVSMLRFTNVVERQLEVHDHMLKVHRGIMDVVQQMSEHIAENHVFVKSSNDMISSLKDMVNGIVGMTAEVEHTYKLLNPDLLCKANLCPYQNPAIGLNNNE